MLLPGPLLAVLATPDVTYLLFVLGIIGLVAEFHHPGTVVPGVVGALALALALIGFNVLGVNWIGVALIVLAAALFIAEAHTTGFGLLALGGLVAFVAGSWALFMSPTGTSGRISLWLIALGAMAVSGYFLIVLRTVLRARRMPYVTGAEALLGQEGVATSDIALRGTVRIRGEEWSAVAEAGPIKAGETVEVLGVEGLTLRVHRPYEWMPSREMSVQ